jgi:predicted RNase H-like HicB family nuclease
VRGVARKAADTAARSDAVVLKLKPEGWVAWSTELPECITVGTSKSDALRKFTDLLVEVEKAEP